MKEKTKQFISFALASSVIASNGITSAFAETTNEKELVEETKPIELTEDGDIVYLINGGDTLSGISVMFYGLPTYYEEIAKYNNIEEPYIIYEGQELLLPRSLNGFLINKETKTFDYENDKLYIVQKNEYLLNIVKKYYGTTYNNINLVNKLATYNLLEDPNLIEVGDVLYIPEIDKLLLVEENDYSIQYKRLEWRINHPGEEYPDELKEKDKELLLIKE